MLLNFPTTTIMENGDDDDDDDDVVIITDDDEEEEEEEDDDDDHPAWLKDHPFVGRPILRMDEDDDGVPWYARGVITGCKPAPFDLDPTLPLMNDTTPNASL